MRMRNLRQNHPLHVYMMETIFGVARNNVPCDESIPPLQQTALDASPPTLQMKTGAAPQVLGMTAQAEVIFPWMAPDTLHWRLLVAMNGCYAGCYDGCYAGCYDGCYAGCYDGCYAGCYDGCYAGCYDGCYAAPHQALTASWCRSPPRLTGRPLSGAWRNHTAPVGVKIYN